MASHFSDMGIPVSEETFEKVVYRIFDSAHGTVLEKGPHIYVVKTIDTQEFWFQVENQTVSSARFEFHIPTDTYLEVSGCRWLHEDFQMAGVLYCQTENYPLHVMIPNRAFAPSFSENKKYMIQVCAFAEEFQVYPNEETFYSSSKDASEYQIGHEACIPIGTFGKDPTVMINGTVLSYEKKSNSMFHGAYYKLKVRSFGGEYVVLVDAKDVQGPLEVGAIVSGTFWLTGKIIEKYVGSELAGLKRQGTGDPRMQTLDDLYNIVSKCWCKETAYPSSQSDWKKSDRAFGQCAITAMLVHNMFGGEIYRIRGKDGTHYFNKLNGTTVDLTSEQFAYWSQDAEYEAGQELDPSYCGKNADTNKRYQLLVQAIVNYLKTHPKE